MKKILFLLLSFAFVTVNAQTVDEIITKYSDAIGGLEAFNKVKTIKMSGTIIMQAGEIPFTTEIINGKAVRLDAEFMGQAIVNSYSNGIGWKINPFGGATTATDVTGTELNDLKSQTSIANNLMDYKNRGHKVELAGNEMVDGVNTFKIKLTAKEDDRITYYFINSTDYLLSKSVTSRDMQGQEVDVETFYKDLKDIDGLKFSMKRSQEVGGQEFQSFVMSKIELNVPVDEKIFQK